MSRTLIDKGGSAFPAPEFYDEKQIGSSEGMTLRDYFAAHAMPAILDIESTSDIGPGRCIFDSHAVAKAAYQIADAMIAARKARL